MHVLISALHRPSKPTGVCRHAANLARCLADTQLIERITLVVGKWQHTYFERSLSLESPKIHLVSIDLKNSSLSRNLWFIFGLPKLAQQLQPDLIHLSFPIPFVRRWFRVPVVSTIHDLYPYESPENFGYPQVWFNRWFLKQCVRSSDGLSCVSRITLNSVNQFFPNRRANQQRIVIYNYVDFSHVEIEAPQALADGENLDFLLCVAQHRKNKNLDLLIETHANLLKEKVLKDSSKLVLVGSPGPETTYLQKLIDWLSLQQKVVFLSVLTDRELGWLYKNCSLFVIPSSTEGFCLPLVEALFWGCKVVCSNIPIFREVGSETCIYFQLEGEPRVNLSEAIVHALDSHPQETLSINQNFLRENVTQNLVGFYLSLDTAR